MKYNANGAINGTTPLIIKLSDEMAAPEETSLLQSANNLVREGEERTV